MSKKKQPQPLAPLDEQTLQEILKNKSGYPFELDIARRVDSAGYFVEPNYSFEDHDTGEARELDFYGLSFTVVSETRGEFIAAVILGSCKDNKNPYVFFTRKPILAGVMLESDIPIAGYPLEIDAGGKEVQDIEDFFGLCDILHIGKAKTVSSQFCEVVWRAKENEYKVESGVIFRDAFIPLIKAMSRAMDDFTQRNRPSEEDQSPTYQIHYPLLVVKGPLFEYHVPARGPAKVRKTKHVLVKRSYESKTVKCEYAIDVIHESYLEQYLWQVDQEVLSFRNLVRRHKRALASSIKRMVALSAGKSPP